LKVHQNAHPTSRRSTSVGGEPAVVVPKRPAKQTQKKKKDRGRHGLEKGKKMCPPRAGALRELRKGEVQTWFKQFGPPKVVERRVVQKGWPVEQGYKPQEGKKGAGQKKSRRKGKPPSFAKKKTRAQKLPRRGRPGEKTTIGATEHKKKTRGKWVFKRTRGTSLSTTSRTVCQEKNKKPIALKTQRRRERSGGERKKKRGKEGVRGGRTKNHQWPAMEGEQAL